MCISYTYTHTHELRYEQAYTEETSTYTHNFIHQMNARYKVNSLSHYVANCKLTFASLLLFLKSKQRLRSDTPVKVLVYQ